MSKFSYTCVAKLTLKLRVYYPWIPVKSTYNYPLFVIKTIILIWLLHDSHTIKRSIVEKQFLPWEMAAHHYVIYVTFRAGSVKAVKRQWRDNRCHGLYDDWVRMWQLLWLYLRVRKARVFLNMVESLNLLINGNMSNDNVIVDGALYFSRS